MGVYYRIMGLPQNATEEDIKLAYRRLARLYHPDSNPPKFRRWAEARMRLLNEAYEILSNPQSRAEYDRSLRDDAFFRERPSKEEVRPDEPTGPEKTGPHETPPRQEAWRDWSYNPPPRHRDRRVDRKEAAPLSLWTTVAWFAGPSLIGLLVVAYLVASLVELGSKSTLPSERCLALPTSLALWLIWYRVWRAMTWKE
ncbi:MAG: J domain-containing protein [Anaerolineae bacterium]